MKIFSLLETQYNDFIQSVNKYLSKVLSKNNTSFGSNTIFGQIITVVGNAIQNVMLYIEDALVEQNKYTAQRKKSIYGLAALSGYTPSLGKATTVSIKLTMTPNNILNTTDKTSFNIIINNKESLTCTQNGLKYNIILPQECIIINNSDVHTRYFTAVQGIFDKQRFVSTGGKYYTINFKFVGNIDTDYIIVKVNNEEWQQVPSLYDMAPAAKQYSLRPGINGGIDLIFGNDCHGKALKANDIIDVEYLIHDGESGNLNPEAETYFVFDNMLADTDGDTYDGNSVFNTTFAELDPVTSGSNSETMEHVREMIGFNSRSLVLATPENYKVLLSKFGFCGYNRTWSDPSSMLIKSLIIKNYKTNIAYGKEYFSLTEDDFKLSDIQKNSLYSYIKNSGNQIVSMNYKILDPVLCKYAAYVYVTLKSGKENKDIISKQIRRYIGMFFTDIVSDYFIPKSDIIQLLKNNIEGIDSVDIYFLSQLNEEALITREYTIEEDSKIINVSLYPGENPNLGLDSHGNILLTSSAQFPVLMGGWQYKNLEGELVQITDPLNIIFEN